MGRYIYDMAFLRHQKTGESKGAVFVEFETVEGAEDALALSGERFIFASGQIGLPCCVERAVDLDLPIKDPDEEKARRDNELAVERHKRTVLVANIDDSISGEDLGKIFGPVGDLQHIRIEDGGHGELIYGRSKDAALAVAQ